MLNTKNIKSALQTIGFTESSLGELEHQQYSMWVDFRNEKLHYPPKIINGDRNTDFLHPENFVVFECVARLLEKGYRPEDIELEKSWSLGHTSKSGRADIIIYENKSKNNNVLCIIECKTAGQEYRKAKKDTLSDGGQLFPYWQQDRSCQWMTLYTSDYDQDHNKIVYISEAIACRDDPNIEVLAKKNKNILLYKEAKSKEDLVKTWQKTYESKILNDVIFSDDTVAYCIGVQPLKKKDLKDFTEEDAIANKFEEILRHNNVSDKENAFNRLIALFICKLVDEIEKDDNDEVEFQYRIGTDTYEELQDRLQRLHRDGMQKFMREKIFYVSDDYARNVITNYTGQNREKLIQDLQATIRILKFYSNNDFSFKDVHNEDLFYQNGKILVEVVQLFENFRIIGSNNLQFLGNLFEQLLNKGFKQNEGQFFTPIPIVRFIWNSLPISKILENSNLEYPKIIDYASGAGHFLTEGFRTIEDIAKTIGKVLPSKWYEKGIFGIEKDYRLARVSKIALFMHGAGEGNIVFGDGLDSYPAKGIENSEFDILVANPPYSVSGFKPHLDLKNNTFNALSTISPTGSEIEVLFVERISQLLKSEGVAAVILPSSLLNKEQESYIAARTSILRNFKIRCITSLGSKTFGETGTATVVLFLEKFKEPPKRIDLAEDSVDAIFKSLSLDNWTDKKILVDYLKRTSVNQELFLQFINRKGDFTEFEKSRHFKKYVDDFKESSDLMSLRKKKSFQTKDSDTKKAEINKLFFDKYHSIERDKLLIFSMIYDQTTLLIDSPSETKDQEHFLGYKWSKRRGQEGMLSLPCGSKLYSNENRKDADKLAYLVQSTFSDNTALMPDELSTYYTITPTKNLIDFDSVKFTKIIQTTPIRPLKDDPSLTLLELSDSKSFQINIGKRVLNSDLITETASSIPVYSANVFEPFGHINQEILTNYSLPSIIWGIDGDWMVNLIPKDTKFYPTDHCGVIRVLTDKVLPDYLRYALDLEGKRMKFSRTYRACIERIQKIWIQVPEISIQKNHLSEVSKFDNIIQKQYEYINTIEKQINDKFNELFGSSGRVTALGSMTDIIEIKKGQLLTRENAQEGNIPVVAGGKTPSCYHNQSNRPANVITVSASGAYAGFVNFWDIPIFASDCNTITVKDTSKINIIYMYYAIKKLQQSLYDSQAGSSQPHVYESDIANLKIYIPPIDIQNNFAQFASNNLQKLKTHRDLLLTAELQKQKYIEQNFS